MSDILLSIFSQDGLATIIKFFIVIIEIIYIVFAFLVIKQVRLMNDSFHTGYAGLFKTASFIHFFAAIALVAISILIL